MSAIVTIPKLVQQKWMSKTHKQLIDDVVWESLSNRTEQKAIVPNGGTNKIPDAVVFYVKDEFKKGIFKTTIPSADKLKKRGQFGWEKVQGNEERPKLRYKSVHYNVERKAVSLEDDSVDGDVAQGYDVVQQAQQFLTDYFAELGDYNKQRALLEGASENLTEQSAWDGSQSFAQPPVTVSLHPTIYYRGASAKVTYSANQNTYRTNLSNALLTMPVDTKYDLSALDSTVTLAQKHCVKLNWKSGDGQMIWWVAKISQIQADQLMNSADSRWSDRYANADVRSVKNRSISGILGVYRNVLLLVDPRAPVYNALDNVFSYQKPWEELDPVSGDYVETVIRNPYTNVGDANSGGGASGIGATFECVQVMGKASLGCSRIKEISFNKDSFDYDFSKGTEARRTSGDERMDFYVDDPTTEEPKNWSSFVYFTPTPTSTY